MEFEKHTIHIENVSDGTEVANAISLYVNSFTNPSEKFYAYMFRCARNIQHNFTILCLEWFSALSKMTNYDDRNRASVEYAQKIVPMLQEVDLKRQKMERTGILPECHFNYRDDENAVRLIEKYLRLSENNTAFISKMKYAHRTNQQSFSRMCGRWFQYVARHSDSRSKYVVLAKKVAKPYQYLPMV